ncbi:chitin deacetylase [Bradyrhizobium ottawaense]|uniref:polysaccharide deacetylase family protein n=1 Tax=Bradyrhizobium ottawaense TaxID=931866 RepID=UPI000BEA237E|nr:polysaccharide deacetylase family protein [Bradyrhizobium ottawaense]PDT63909.1 chitin deacetylase [Bradyrhizobium ottawaense]
MAHTWPRDAKCVVNITVDFDGPCIEIRDKVGLYGKHSHGRYSAKRGVPRLLDIVKKHDIRVTFYVPGYDAEQHPEVVKAIADAGHEIAAHSYLHERWDLGAEEPSLLRKTHKILTDIVGKPPIGWRCAGGLGKSNQTIKLLRELGYIYDSSEKCTDWPFFPSIDGEEVRDFINLPDNVSSLDDYPFYWLNRTPPSEVLQQWKDEFHSIYAEGGYYDLILHARNGFGSGTPTRAKVLDDLISFMKSYPNVLFQTQEETARWCLSNPTAWPARRNPRAQK